MKRKVTLLILGGLIFTGFFLLGYWALSIVSQAKSYQTAYDLILTGDSRGDVLEKFGHLSNTVACQNNINSSPDCSEELEYTTLFERWIVSLDKDDKVVHKSHGVSF